MIDSRGGDHGRGEASRATGVLGAAPWGLPAQQPELCLRLQRVIRRAEVGPRGQRAGRTRWGSAGGEA
jgi:hypothetical protein